MTTSSDILEMRGVSKRFANVTALDQVDFSVRRGEIHALIGENGAGKSTLIKILSGAYQPDSGGFSLDGKPALRRSPALMQHQGISVIYQELNLVPHLNVARNIFLGHEPVVVPGVIDFRTMHRRAAELVSQLGVPISTHALITKLGIAEQQLVEVAKALSYQVRLLVMDEPTAPLSEHEAETLFDVVRRLRDRGVTVVYISHRLEEIFRLADRVTVLRDGRVVGTRMVHEVHKGGSGAHDGRARHQGAAPQSGGGAWRGAAASARSAWAGRCHRRADRPRRRDRRPGGVGRVGAHGAGRLALGPGRLWGRSLCRCAVSSRSSLSRPEKHTMVPQRGGAARAAPHPPWRPDGVGAQSGLQHVTPANRRRSHVREWHP